MSTIDTRAKSILHWLSNTLKLEVKSFEPASSDASFRRYFRVIHSKGQHIVMDAPPEKENTEPFIRIATLFKKSGINVPQIYQQELEQGFLLLEDFGSICYLDKLDNVQSDKLYSDAIDSLLVMQSQIDPSSSLLPKYDKNLLKQETSLFYDWFLQKHLGLLIPETIIKSLDQILISSALEQPPVCVHRDYHSRNLMVLTSNSPGVIDFQDAVIGPITYDLVSLLRDCYISWSEEKIQQWVFEYYQQITKSGLTNVSIDTFTRWFDLMGLQRHLKAIGIFSRLHIRDNKSAYLDDIPRTLNYVIEVCNRYPELEKFRIFLTDNKVI